MLTIYIVYFCSLGLFLLLSITWSLWQNSIDINLIEKTKKLLVQKDGWPNKKLTKQLNLKQICSNLDIKYCQHPCRLHFPKLNYPKTQPVFLGQFEQISRRNV